MSKIDDLLKQAKEQKENKTTSDVPEPPPQSEPVRDWNKALAHIADIQAYLDTFIGKANVNPFLFSYENIKPLQAKYESGDRSPELYQAILSLKKVEPTVEHIKLTRIDLSKVVELVNKARVDEAK